MRQDAIKKLVGWSTRQGIDVMIDHRCTFTGH